MIIGLVIQVERAGQLQTVAIALRLEFGEQPFAGIELRAQFGRVRLALPGELIGEIENLIRHVLKLQFTRTGVARGKSIAIIEHPAAHSAFGRHVLAAANLLQRLAFRDALADLGIKLRRVERRPSFHLSARR